MGLRAGEIGKRAVSIRLRWWKTGSVTPGLRADDRYGAKPGTPCVVNEK
jgi:hypothetical protein